MSIILGIDIGGSTTKIVGLRPDGSPIAMHRVQAQDPITSLYGALGNFLVSNRLQLGDVGRVALTGVGASYVESDIFGIPTDKVEEFTAVGAGGLSLSGLDRCVVVSMGTGTAFIWAERGREVRHLCGSGVGGGTLAGLCSRLCGTRQYDQIVKLAASGDVGNVDLTVGDITRNTHQLRQRVRRCHRRGLRRRGGEHGPPVHRHHGGDGLPGLRLRHRGAHRLHGQAAPGPGLLRPLYQAPRGEVHHPGERALRHRHRRGAERGGAGLILFLERKGIKRASIPLPKRCDPQISRTVTK